MKPSRIHALTAGLRRPRFLWVLPGLLLLWLVLRGVAWAEVWSALARLTPWQILVLVGANGAVLLLLLGRWWIVLLGLGHRLPFWTVCRYGLGGAAVSYFTPGPQFGGEPLQVWLLTSRHRIPPAAAAASVTIDKGLTLLTNFTFLLVGMLLLAGRWLPSGLAGRGVLLTGGLLILPVFLLGSWFLGFRPLARLPWPAAGRLAAAGRLVAAAEGEVISFFRERPRWLLGSLGLALLSWLGLIAEYWLMATFLGLPLNGEEALVMLTAVRLAWLLPVPTALGTLEAAQISALALIGLGQMRPLGVGLSLLIRLRDVLVGLAGLWGVAGLRRVPAGAAGQKNT